MINEPLIFLLLIIAIGSGWLLGRFQGKKLSSEKSVAESLPNVDLLLAETNDKALDRILDVQEITDEAVELYLNLGRIFRDKGQSEKAIQLHQSLFARNDLSIPCQADVELELATDFLRAGLLDRAERLLKELNLNRGRNRLQASRLLIELYEEEKSWKAILDLYKSNQLPDSPDISNRVAHSACEYANNLFLDGEYLSSHKYLKLALKINPLCARANVEMAEIARAQGEVKEAIRCYIKALKQDDHIIVHILDGMIECFRKAGDEKELLKQLSASWQRSLGIQVLLAKTNVLIESDQLQQAIDELLEELFKKPSNKGFFALVQMVVSNKGELNKSQLMAVYDILKRIVEAEPIYVCRSCGFKTREHYWRCPSCKSWSSVGDAS